MPISLQLTWDLSKDSKPRDNVNQDYTRKVTGNSHEVVIELEGIESLGWREYGSLNWMDCGLPGWKYDCLNMLCYVAIYTSDINVNRYCFYFFTDQHRNSLCTYCIIEEAHSLTLCCCFISILWLLNIPKLSVKLKYLTTNTPVKLYFMYTVD